MRLRHLRTLEPIAYVETPPSEQRRPPTIQAALQAGHGWWPRAGFAHPRACRASFLNETMPTLMATAQERERTTGAPLDGADPYPLPARPWLYAIDQTEYDRLVAALTA